RRSSGSTAVSIEATSAIARSRAATDAQPTTPPTGPAMPAHSQSQLLRTRRFLPFFLTQALGAFNDNLFKNALVILILFQGTSLGGLSPTHLSIVAAGLFI